MYCRETGKQTTILELQGDEVMMLFGFKTVKTVYRWIRTGRLKYIVTPGGRKRITRSEILRIAQEVQANPEVLME
jgi:predicted site-specific integrase-resolvase